MIDRVGLRTGANTGLGASGGQQQRVRWPGPWSPSRPCFRRRADRKPRPKASEDVLTMLRAAVDEVGQTVIMVTHELDAAAHGDRLIALRDGN